jgi:hypothetical protein
MTKMVPQRYGIDITSKDVGQFSNAKAIISSMERDLNKWFQAIVNSSYGKERIAKESRKYNVDEANIVKAAKFSFERKPHGKHEYYGTAIFHCINQTPILHWAVTELHDILWRVYVGCTNDIFCNLCVQKESTKPITEVHIEYWTDIMRGEDTDDNDN